VSPVERLKGHLVAIVEAVVGRRLDYHALYPCTVVLQDPITGRLDLLPDDDKVRGFGVTGVPIKTGMPGWLVGASTGSRVLLGFEGGDPKRPYVALWETAATLLPPVPPVLPGQVAYSAATLDATVNPIADYVARTNDSVRAGHLIFDPTIFALYWAPDVVGVAGVYSLVPTPPMAGVPPPPGSTGLPITGRVTSGNPNLRA
jgi:hypothetical protein